eukprot:TRINITY_DN185_c0_g1_i5.p1 TRINITY_DN185_c0_g1~~TRINITY_DN185_c0_g1_i5.p1  ORF type:complete len:122 (-),score=23.34 TRINITY_DN185_c0_g1_i5:411-776(-)
MRSADFIKDLSWSASLASSAFLDAVHVVVYAPDFVWIGFDMKGHYDTLCGKLQVNRNGCLIVEDDFSEHGSSPFKQHFLRKNPNKRLFKLRTWFSPIGTGLHITRLAPATQPLLSSPSPAS